MNVLNGDFSDLFGTEIGSGRVGELSLSSKVFLGDVMLDVTLPELDGGNGVLCIVFFSLSFPLPRSLFLSPRVLGEAFMRGTDSIGALLSVGLEVEPRVSEAPTIDPTDEDNITSSALSTSDAAVGFGGSVDARSSTLVVCRLTSTTLLELIPQSSRSGKLSSSSPAQSICVAGEEARFPSIAIVLT